MSVQSEELKKIEGFKKGYSPFMDAQIAHAKAGQQLLNSGIFTQDEKRVFSNSVPEIDKQFSAIQTFTRQFSMELNGNSLERDAARDYHSYFKGEVREHQLSFIVFLKLYIQLVKFTKSLQESWKKIKDLVLGSRLTEGSEFRKQLLTFRIEPVFQDIESLKIFTSRMATILGVENDPLTVRDFSAIAKYREEGLYQLSTVFSESIAGFTPPPMDWGAIGAQNAPRGIPAQASPIPGGVETYRLNAGGNLSWNRTSHYFFSYDPRLLDEERKKFTDVVHVDTHMGADQDVMRSERILKYTRTLAQQTVHGNTEQEYTNFIQLFFNLVIEITCLNVAMPPNLRPLFLFHLGPQSFYYLTRRFLQEIDTGTIHRKSGKGAVMEKFVPGELVKKSLLEWWNQDILKPLGPEKDEMIQYKAIVKVVKDTYDRLSSKAMAEYDQLPEAQKVGKNRAEIIRENLNKWLGPTNIIVFRRFLKAGTA